MMHPLDEYSLTDKLRCDKQLENKFLSNNQMTNVTVPILFSPQHSNAE